MKRVIFVEPKTNNCEDILNIFNKYNPDSSFVNPHICLVFPFESNLDSKSIEILMKDVLRKYYNFDIYLSGLRCSYEKNNNFLFINVLDESNILTKISSELYSKLGDNAKLKGEYQPHITIGKSKNIEEINRIYEEANSLLRNKYKATISNVYCKRMIRDSDGNKYLDTEIDCDLLLNRGNI